MNFEKSGSKNESSNLQAASHIKNSDVTIQRKLSIGAVNDPLEYEADAMADKVMRMPEPNLIQKKCAHCEEEERAQRKPLESFIQRKSSENNIASNAITNKIQSTKGGGNAMHETTKSFMESRFGADFSDVRIHSNNNAAKLSNQLNAQAFTVGKNIYFNEGKYQPESSEGKRLLAHELTHTVQQGAVQTKIQRVPAGMQLFPYTGYIIPSQANVRDAASMHGNVLVTIPANQQLLVLGVSPASADWLNVQLVFNSTVYTGFAYRRNIARTQNFTNTTDTGNVYTSQIAFQNSRIVISKRVNFINGGGFTSVRRFNRMKRRFINTIHDFLNARFSIKISTPGAHRGAGDGVYPIAVRVIDDTSGPYNVTFMGNAHGTSNTTTAGGTFFELGQPTESILPNITLAHEGSHLILGQSDEYPNAAVPTRALFTDHSLLGNFYNEGISRARIKHRHFAFVVPIMQAWFPGKTVTLIP